jgi:hypothetical protein
MGWLLVGSTSLVFCSGGRQGKASGSFLKKRTKKRLSVRISGAPAAVRTQQPGKVFWFFFSKKNRFASLQSARFSFSVLPS